jgi:hypothetical protein
MITVTILQTESTVLGDMVELTLDKHIEPAIGMILMDENSRTWEVTAILHDAKRITEEHHFKRWTFQCRPVNTDSSIHPGEFKLIH